MKLLSHIRKDMDFNTSLYGLIEVLIAISISHYRILERKIKLFEAFFASLESFFSLLPVEGSAHPFVNMRKRPPGIIVVTSDSGLVGGLNTQAIHLALSEVQGRNASLIIIGEQGKLIMRQSSVPFVFFKGIQDEIKSAQAAQLREYVAAQEVSGKIGELKIIYPRPISIAAQRIEVLKLIPFSYQESAPSAGRIRAVSELLIESSLDDMVGYLGGLYLGHKFSEIFSLARLAELSARFMHLENSKTKIEQLNKELKLQYLKQRHEVIDRNMRELFVARLAFQRENN